MAKRCGRLNLFPQETRLLASRFATRSRFLSPRGQLACAARDGQTPFPPALQTNQTPANVSLRTLRQIRTARAPPGQGCRDNSNDCRPASRSKEYRRRIVFGSEKPGALGGMTFAARMRAPTAANPASKMRSEVHS